MDKPWRLTRRAESALAEIAVWTVETFGERQAARYEADLIARCAALAEGSAPSRACRETIDPVLPERLRMARSGAHVIIFIDTPALLVIVDILHGARDLPRQLVGLGALDPD